MNVRTEALLAVDPRDLTDAERAALDAELAADDGAALAALGVALDAELAEAIGDPLAAPAPRRAAAPRLWFAAAAAVLLLAAAIALVVLLRSEESAERADTVAPAPPNEPLPERREVAPAPGELRAFPTAGARPQPRQAAGKDPKAAKLHAKRGQYYEKAGDHETAAFAYVDAFRALPTEPMFAYSAAAEMARAGWCTDAIDWYRFAIALDPDGDFVAEANQRARYLSEQCDFEPAVIALNGPSEGEARARYARAKQLYAAGDYRGAARLFAGAYDGLPVPELAYNVAAAYHRSDDCANTVAWFEHYLAVAGLAPDAEAVEGLIAAYQKVGCDEPVSHPPPSEAEVIDPKQTHTPPKDVNVWQQSTASTLADEASEQAKLGNYGRAMKKCEDALDLDPDQPKARMVCTIASCKMKNHKRAQKHYEHLSAASRRAVVQLCKGAGIELTEPEQVEADVPERLTRADISKTVGSVRSLIGECGRTSGYAGTMTVKMTIDPDGTVSKAEADPGGDAGVCVEQVLKSLQFPESQSAISVSYPLVFR